MLWSAPQNGQKRAARDCGSVESQKAHRPTSAVREADSTVVSAAGCAGSGRTSVSPIGTVAARGGFGFETGGSFVCGVGVNYVRR
jgi:hypothetical protein